MPWLIKDKPTLEEKLFFVHVPRCGGTSLMHHFEVPTKCLEGRSWWGKFGMRVFFHRYKLLESANFPVKTYGNLLAIIIMGLSIVSAATMYNEHPGFGALSICLAVLSFIVFMCFSFVFTAPVIGRLDKVRRCYLVFVHYILCRFMESIEWCTGTNRTGYMMHLTAHKLLHYGYISPEEMENVCSMAIVRNPYSRMVSMYNYNKFGTLESFPQFVRSWYQHTCKMYREEGEMDEWYTPCHAIPQFEFTHFEGMQIVQAIVKQEELKYLKNKDDMPKALEQDNTIGDLPDPVRDALLGMPHMNGRKTTMKWFEYFDQETLNLTYEMYQHDFVVFGYDPVLTQRTDLQPPKLFVEQQQQHDKEVGSVMPSRCLEPLVRDSSKSSMQSQNTRKRAVKRSSKVGINVSRHQFGSSMVGPSQQLHLSELSELDIGSDSDDEEEEENDSGEKTTPNKYSATNDTTTPPVINGAGAAAETPEPTPPSVASAPAPQKLEPRE